MKKRIPLMESLCGVEDAALIFASSCRLSRVVSDVLAKEQLMSVRIAAVLGLAAKFTGVPVHVEEIWDKVASKQCLPEVFKLEQAVFAAWAAEGLEGDYALETTRRCHI